MSEFDFDNIGSLLNDVLEDKPVGDAKPKAPQPEETVEAADETLIEPEVVITEPEVDDVENMLADLMTDDAEVEPEVNDPEEPEVTQCVSSEPEVNDTPEVSEHVFAEPVEQAIAPLPTFTTDEIADSLDIRNFATLVTLNTARWQAKVKDRKAAKDAADKAGASPEAFEARKKLLAGCDAELKQVHKAIDAARTEHYRLTMPWSTVGVNDIGKRTGGRLMPNTLFMEYTTAMAKAKAEMDALVKQFVDKYPSLLAVAEKKLGSAFDPAQYPNPASIASHFRLSFDFHPIPVGADFKGLQESQIEKLGTALNKKTRSMLENALQDAWQQLYDTVSHAAATFSTPKQMFHASLIEKLRDQAAMLKHLNATKDSRFEEVRKMVEAGLIKHDAKDIRKDEDLRKRLGEAAKEVVKYMQEAVND